MVVPLRVRLGRLVPHSKRFRPPCSRLSVPPSLPQAQLTNVGAVSTPAPANLSDEDLFVGPMASRPLDQPTTTTHEIVISDLVFVQQQWGQPRKALVAAGGEGGFSLETGAFVRSPAGWDS